MKELIEGNSDNERRSLDYARALQDTIDSSLDIPAEMRLERQFH